MDHSLVFGIHEEKPRRTVVQVEDGFLGRKPPVDRQDNSAECSSRPVEQEVLEAVLAQHPDPITFVNPRLLKPCGQPVHLLFHLGKSQAALIVDLQPGRPVVETDRVAVDQIVERKVVQSHRFTTLASAGDSEKKHPSRPTAE